MKPFETKVIGHPEKWLVQAAADVNVDLAGFTHELTNHFQNHVLKRHGKGSLAITEKDFAKIPGILKSPDMAIIGAFREGTLINAYVKREVDVTYLYFEEVLDSTHNKALRSRTFYKIGKLLDPEGFKKIVTMNGITDISGAKKI
ncbi:MAG: hypothetical protein LBH42_10285 [Treponema sp.]|jgi:hypothetical protein|nr:hypothetical protein [Treponema sp.]